MDHENYTFCDSEGPVRSYCVKISGHAGEHEGYDTFKNVYRWTTEDYPHTHTARANERSV